MDKNYYSFIVPAGRYWLTDPAYVLNEQDWTNYLTSCAKSAAEYKANYEQLETAQVLSFAALCGSGQYKDQNNELYCTDSGLLGLVSYSYNAEPDMADCGILVEFNAETLCCASNGILVFGDKIIDTAANCTQSDGMEL